MEFSPRSHGISGASLAVCLTFGAVSVALLLSSWLGQGWAASLWARPEATSAAKGPVKLSGAVDGQPVRVSSGDSALVAVFSLWDRNPSKKNARQMCRWVEAGSFRVGEHGVSWDTANRRINETNQRPIGQPGSMLIELSSSAARPLNTEMLGRCPGAAFASVSLLRPHEQVTITGCKKGDEILPCGDGTDVLLGYSPQEAASKLKTMEIVKLILAALAGFPSLMFLILRLSRYAPSMEPQAFTREGLS